MQEKNITSQTFEVDETQGGERLDKFISSVYTDQSRSFFQKLIKAGNVSLNGNVVTKAGMFLNEGDIVNVLVPEPVSVEILPENIELDILYEDDDIIIVNKPKGMVVHPSPGHYTGTLVNAIMYHCADSLSGINGDIRPGIVHRIDKDTTGLLIVCKNDMSHISIARQIRDHSVTRIYLGIVHGNISDDTGTISKPIGRHPTQRKKMSVNLKNGKRAVTNFRVIERFRQFTYMEFSLETGRTHQIRVHMADQGHPLLGDDLYGNAKNSPFKGLTGQTLHAAVIGFLHPKTEEYMEFSAPVPDYFETILTKLRSM